MDQTPDWLNNEFLEKALNSKKGSVLKVVSSEITKGTAPGDNYGSDIYRAIVQISKNGLQEKKSFIIKAELTNPEVKKMISEVNAFQREIDAFNIAIPHLESLIERNAPEFYRPYAAKCFYTSNDPPSSVLVLEDLKEAGFRLANPSQVLDTKHCFLVVNTLATYHAASVVFNHNNSRKLEKVFKEGPYRESTRDVLEKMFKRILNLLIAEAEKWPECQGEILAKLRLLESNSTEYLLDCVKTNDKDFRALVHEDVWVNNLMFHYSEDTKEVVDVRVVDFQSCHWTSPVIDLLYFINANASIENIKKPEIILDEYYKRLRETFSALGHDHLCPSKEYIYSEFEKRCKFGVIIGIACRSVILMDRTEVLDLSKMLNNEDFMKFSEAFKKDVKQMLPIFNERGWL